jgi:hypothetical protein
MTGKERLDSTDESGIESGLESGRGDVTPSSDRASEAPDSSGRWSILDPDELIGETLHLDLSQEEFEYLPLKKQPRVSQAWSEKRVSHYSTSD